MKLQEKYLNQINEFISACRKLAEDFYVTSSGGNLAWKLEDNLMLISPTKMNKGDISPEEIVFIDMEGAVVEGKNRPTGETPMYLKFFKERSDIISVIHSHPPNVCALAISKEKNWLMRPLFPETVIEIGPVPIVPYAEPLTETLANNFVPFLRKYDSFIMENHGLLTMSREGIQEALMKVQLIEMSAKSILLANMAGEIKELDQEDVKNLDRTMQTRTLPMIGVPGVNKSLEELYFTY